MYLSGVPLTVACFLDKGGVVKHLNLLQVGKSCAQVWEGRLKHAQGCLRFDWLLYDLFKTLYVKS